jgi:hypothetical protein
MSLLDSIGGFFAAGSQKKQAKKNIADYGAAEKGSLDAYGGARDASLGYYQPYAQGGQEAFARAGQMQTPGFQYNPSDPSYAFRFGEGVNAIDRSAAARGGIGSGGTLKALTRYGQGLASTEFAADFERNNQIAKYGFNAAQGQAGVQNNYAQGVSNTLFGAADGRSGARTAKGDAIAEQWGAGVSAVKDVAAFFL